MNDNNFFKKLNTKENNLELEANFEGDWTLLLKDRLLSPEIKKQQLEKTSEWVEKSLEEIRGEVGDIDTDDDMVKAIVNLKVSAAKKMGQMAKGESYDEFIERTFSNTEYISSEEDPNSGEKIASSTGGLGGPGTLYKDRLFFKSGIPFSTRQKNMIESHEKGHSVRVYFGAQKEDIESCIERSLIPEKGREYLGKAEEIIERMSSLKNYFGFSGGELFTKEHLDYSREHFISDMNMDVGMREFFYAITPDKEESFLRVINTYGV